MKNKKIVRFSLFLALAVVFNYLEHLIVLPMMFPGAHLGLANALGMVILYFYGKKDYLLFGILRIVLAGLLFNGFGSSFLISLLGYVLASITTILLFSLKRFSIFGVSCFASIMHGVGQVIMVCIIYQTTQMLFYLSILTPACFVSGLLMALISKIIIRRLTSLYGGNL